ncbi:hypothetical protein [Sporomusa termitida]|uniref:Uncharacterized protein n=1 Tax=Sporomusa termitida TaxID=2377 RepID=A0A517DPP7_9FIRM|nr:hypothetical protein [Sporomusa termitida]QDR79334.1 hypothetical protein SPTER_06070 [Sporomusa termitida]
MHKISNFSWFGFPISMEERFKLIKAAGFDHQIPGAGTIAWSTLMKKIKQTGYTGAIALKVDGKFPLGGQTPEKFLKKAFAAVQKLCQ